jgi:hypothetical protein
MIENLIAMATGLAAARWVADKNGINLNEFGTFFNRVTSSLSSQIQSFNNPVLKKYSSVLQGNRIQSEAIHVARGGGFFAKASLTKDEAADLAYSTLEILSRPNIKSALHRGNINVSEISEFLQKTKDPAAIKNFLDERIYNNARVLGFAPDIKTEVSASIARKVGIANRMGRTSYNKMISDVQATLSYSEFFDNGASRMLRQNQLFDYQTLRQNPRLQEGFEGLTRLVKSMSAAGAIEGSDIVSLMKEKNGRRNLSFFLSGNNPDNSFHYARLQTNAGSVMIPLEIARVNVGGQQAPIYPISDNARTMAAHTRYIGRMNPATGAIESVDEFERAIFWGSDTQEPALVQINKRALEKGTTMRDEIMKNTEHVPIGARGTSVLLSNATQMKTEGLEEYIKNVESSGRGMSVDVGQHMYNQNRIDELRSLGYDPAAFSSPNQAGKNILHLNKYDRVTGQIEREGIWSMLSDPNGYSGIRRPGQSLIGSYEMRNRGQYTKRTARYIDGTLLYSGTETQLFKMGGAFEAMSRQGFAPMFDRGVVFLSDSMKALDATKTAAIEESFGVGREGVIYNINQDRRSAKPIFKGPQQVFRIEGISEEFPELKVNKRLVDLIDIAKKHRDDPEARAAAIREWEARQRQKIDRKKRITQTTGRKKKGKGVNRGPYFKNGDWLGQTVGHSGLQDTTIRMGGTGLIGIEDIQFRESGIELTLARRMRLGNYQKSFGQKGLNIHLNADKQKELTSRLDVADTRAKLLTTDSEIGRSGNTAYRLLQQHTGLMMMGVDDMHPSSGNNLTRSAVLERQARGDVKALGVVDPDRYVQTMKSIASEGTFMGASQDPMMQHIYQRRDNLARSIQALNLDDANPHKRAIAIIQSELGKSDSGISRTLSLLGASYNLAAVGGLGKEATLSSTLGKIFGLERYKATEVAKDKMYMGQLGALLEEPKTRELVESFIQDSYFGVDPSIDAKSFTSQLETGIREAKYVEGMVMRTFRDQAGAFYDSRPTVERRAVQMLMRTSDDSSMQFGSKTEKEMLLEEIFSKQSTVSQKYASQVRRLISNYEDSKIDTISLKGSDVNARSLSNAFDQGGFFLDLDDLYVPGNKENSTTTQFARRVYIPTKAHQEALTTGIYSSGELIETGYSDVMSRFKAQAMQYVEPGFNVNDMSRFKETISEMARGVSSEIGRLWHPIANMSFSGDMLASTYEMLTPDLTDVSKLNMYRDSLGNIIRSTEGGGNVLTVNRAAAADLLGKIKEQGFDDEDMLKQIQQMFDTKSKTPTPIIFASVQRSPTISRYGRTVMGLRYDPSLPNDAPIIQVGQRQMFVPDDTKGTVELMFENSRIKGNWIDVNPLLSAASSHDYDGDRLALAILMTGDRNLMMNQDKMLSVLGQHAESKQSYFLQYKAAVNAMEKQSELRAIAQGITAPESLPDFIKSGKKLFGQSEIGMLSYQIDRIKYGANIAKHLGHIDDATFEALTVLTQALEQEGISFKHLRSGRSVGFEMAQDFASIFEMGMEPGSSAQTFKEKMTKYFGNEIFEGGVEYGGTSIKLNPASIDNIGAGFAAASSKMGNETYQLIRAKSEDIEAKYAPSLLEALSKNSDDGLMEAEHLYGQMQRDFFNMYDETILNEQAILNNWSSEQVAEMNAAMKERASRRGQATTLQDIISGQQKMASSAAFSRLIKPTAAGLGVAALTYAAARASSPFTPASLEELGPLDIPENGTSMQGQYNSGAGADLMRPEGHRSSSGGMMPTGNDSVNIPQVSAPMINRGFASAGTGRINVRDMSGDNGSTQAMLSHLRASMPHSQVGVTVNHNYRVPRNIEDKM